VSKEQIKWKGTRNREIMYQAVKMVLGPLGQTKPEAQLSVLDAEKVERIMRETCVLPARSLVYSIGMQFRWCVTGQDLKDQGQVELTLHNKLAALRAGYMSISQVLEVLTRNGFDPAKISDLLKTYVAGIHDTDELLLNMRYRKAHPVLPALTL
jgi:hypothetical protein